MNYFLEAFKKYVDFDGRASRKELWLFVLFNILVSAIIQVVDSRGSQSLLLQIYQLAVVVPTIAVSIRRMHDVSKSGWFILIPIYNIILYCTAGDSGSNKYGAKPQELK